MYSNPQIIRATVMRKTAMMQVGTRLRQIRQTHKQTLADVGAATDLSISYLSKIERNRAEPTLTALNRLANHFEITVSDFLNETDEPNRINSIHRPSFRGFIERMNGQVDGAMQEILLRVDARAEKPASSVEEWLQYYYVISAITSSR